MESANREYIEALHEEYLRDPQSVGEEWRKYFEGLGSGPEPGGTSTAAASRPPARPPARPTRAAEPALPTPVSLRTPLPPIFSPPISNRLRGSAFGVSGQITERIFLLFHAPY